ncbi:DNA primase [Lachnospiraceae bacterium XBB2008]|nr:DNA primase [Lachnospiraceae bacterium]SCY43716.1 DNA primase [Lachnospiraceae bacterium XBB2008]
MRYSDELIEEIRSKNDIVDVIGGYVHLQKKGSTYFGLCPFHNEKTASFSVTPSKQMYYCFGCHKGGNVITFLMEYENYSFQEAMAALAEKAGVELPEPDQAQADRSRDILRKRMLEVNKEAAKYYAYLLRSPKGEPGINYLKGRGLTDDTLNRFGLGFADVSSDSLVRYLVSKGYDDQLLIDAGLAVFDEKSGLHDRFWNRVMYPIMDANNRVIGFGGRVMGDAKPKYLNSRETFVFDKSRNLYGLNLARSSRTDYFILCEGYMDVIAMHQAGFNMAVASLGTAFTSGQATLLRRFVRKVYLAYDSDQAGIDAALKAIAVFRDMDMNCRIINMEPHKDPDEFIKTLGKEEFQKRIDDAEDGFFFELRIMARDYDLKAPDSRSEFTYRVVDKLLGFEDEIKRENYLIAAADRYAIPVDQLKREIIKRAAQGRKVTYDSPRSGIQKAVTNEELILKKQRNLITWLSEDPSIFSVVKKYIEPSDFTDPLYAEVVRQLFADLERNGEPRPAAIISTFDDEADQSRVAELFNTSLVLDADNDKAHALHDVIYMVKKSAVEARSASDVVDAESITRQMNDKKALEELRKTTITL